MGRQGASQNPQEQRLTQIMREDEGRLSFTLKEQKQTLAVRVESHSAYHAA
jgi:hypothetical protein